MRTSFLACLSKRRLRGVRAIKKRGGAEAERQQRDRGMLSTMPPLNPQQQLALLSCPSTPSSVWFKVVLCDDENKMLFLTRYCNKARVTGGPRPVYL